jgi:50S ribosomal subunit-associated GTPase HflX
LRVVDATNLDLLVTAPSEVLVVNKVDLNPGIKSRYSDVANAAFVSAKTNDGIDRLLMALIERLIPCPPRPGEAVPITLAQRQFLARLR